MKRRRVTSPDTHLPPVVAIEAALRKTTHRLACETAAPAADPPDWSDFEWRVAMAAGAMQGVTVLLANRLRWQGPALWQGFLEEQKRQGALRQQRIVELLAQIDRAAAAAGIALVALKGSALLSLGLYGPGERPMGDIDLLVGNQDFESTGRLLQTLHYASEVTTWRHQVFVPETMPACVRFGEHVANPIKIELHTRIMERLPVSVTDITSSVFPRSAHAGSNSYPSKAALLRHLLLHAAGGIQVRALRFIQLHDIVLLSTRLDGSDWDELLSESAAVRGLWWAWPPLALVNRYHPLALPRAIVDRIERQCPMLLRRATRSKRLEDVSWAQLRIQAFPGVEWARSPQEALKFMAGRVFPDRVTMALRRHAVVTQPTVHGAPWSSQSQPRRILRWVFSTPPRVSTMHSIRLALEYTLPSQPSGV